ncbi:1-aminocyclopropane-1-carboxylate deaminase/D-cysteine desulfhydrase [Allomuricauda sp. SCSIO 65647]|uniref:1-aminocyclopropane-1-carboxylate deaminase/D-cysteine desulfhydrase n=1 Tax=Allomuricauda sp. SCSIO 65647 TaxID=2908843 RepID=UPI001F261525|nr:pyridoxal-phosphate dependent enzyme [Muricauda sp. SCSIO 65647]UJH66431.1 pyridoxal-phosphate dependent enzyme [Muricauda sp. SCSIO 65647]
MKSHNQQIDLPELRERGITLFIKREDELHPHISGNKFRKLKYNLIRAKEEGHSTLLTFGGAFSNHILATACAGNENAFDTIGIIRGEELRKNWKDNPTLQLAAAFGMRFHFVSRDEYRQKTSSVFLEALQAEFGDFYLLPEGGTNTLAIKGCEEILTENDADFDIICCAVGTGGTLTGLINSASREQAVWGYPALKGDFLKEDIRTFAINDNWRLITSYHFGGYAKINCELIDFINDFKNRTGIALDPVYTGKMLYGIFDQAKKGFFSEGSRILAIHTGGLQGIKGMNLVLKKKKLPLLNI